MRTLKLLLAVVLAVSLGGCSWMSGPKDETAGWSASQIYSAAKESLNEGDYEQAIRYFELLEARYPFGRFAQQAQLEVAYAYYKFEEPESAIAAADRFIKLHPRHPHVDYAYYLKGLVNFNRNTSIVERLLPQDPATRDPGSARQAFFDFRELVRSFPNSRYAEDAAQRMHFLRNTLARHEINVAQYYMLRGAYVAAANRAKYVVEHYEGSTSVPQALAVMADAYQRMGLRDLAHDANRVLSYNYPDFTPKPYRKDTGWLPF